MNTFPRLTVPCPACETEMVLLESQREGEDENPIALDLYQCPTADCQRKMMAVFEPQGGMTPDQATWVEQEVRRKGAFFPQDYVGTPGRGRR